MRDPEFMAKAKAETGLAHFLRGDGPKITTSALGIARKSLEHAKKVITSEKYNIVILDEINSAIDYDLAKLKDVIQLIKEKLRKVELILTGRGT